MGVRKLLWTLLVLGHCISWISCQARDSNVREIRQNLLYPCDADDRLDGIDYNNPQLHRDYEFDFPYFGFNFNYTYISVFGVITFSRTPSRLAYPLKFPIDEWPRHNDPALIAPFYAAAQIGEAGSGTLEAQTPAGVYLRVYTAIGTRGEDLERQLDIREALRQDIQDGMVGASDFVPKHVIIVTWRNVTFGGSMNMKITNTYQMVMTTDEIRTYVMFNYDRIQWTSSRNSGGTDVGIGGTPAFVGFNAGNGTRAFEYLPYSQSQKVIDLRQYGYINGHPGRHMFRVDEEILQGSCNFEPAQNPQLFISPESGHMLGGTIINITGPCFTDRRNKIEIKFNDVTVECLYRNRNLATCVTKPFFSAGYVDARVRLDSAGIVFSTKFYIENPMIPTDHVLVDNREVLNKLDAKVLKIRWSWNNLTHDTNHPVSINLYGYREFATHPSLIFITTLAQGIPNDGTEEIDLAPFQNNDDSDMLDFIFGLIEVNTTLEPINMQQGDTSVTPQLWSQPIPLGWYFHKQWVRHYGEDWAAKFCERWDLDDRRLTTFAHQVPRCPCNIEQANADKGRFAPDFGCDKWGNAECYGNQKTLHCLRSGQPSVDGAGQQCCYGADGDLVMNTDMIEGGTPSRSHPFGLDPYDTATKVPGLSHWYHDQSAYLVCCQWQPDSSAGCYQYKWRRASQDCIGYQPPNSSVVFGDPHFITFDNLEYTFNGKGEFSLVRIYPSDETEHNLDVQGRFEYIVDTIKKTVLPATLLSSVAARDQTSVTVEIQMRPSEARKRYRLNVLVDGKRIYFDRPAQKLQSFKGVTVYCPSQIHNQSHIVAMFQSGAGVEVIENDGYMAARVYLPKSFMNATAGLMGNWSNDIEDDFTPPPDEQQNIRPTISSTSSFEQIHRDFGIHWMVHDSEQNGIKGTRSLFTHENKRSSAFYNNQSFVPNFNREPLWLENMTFTLADVDSVCGNKLNPKSYQCRYDYIITQNKQFAQVTKYNADSFRKMKSELKTITTCGALETPRYGKKSSNKYTVHTEVKFECQRGYVLEGEPIRWCYLSGEWSWVEFGITRCLHEDDYNAQKAGIAAGIVIAIIVAAAILGGTYITCVLNNRKYDAVYYTGESGESHEMTKRKGDEVDKPPRKYSTEA